MCILCGWSFGLYALWGCFKAHYYGHVWTAVCIWLHLGVGLPDQVMILPPCCPRHLDLSSDICTSPYESLLVAGCQAHLRGRCPSWARCLGPWGRPVVCPQLDVCLAWLTVCAFFLQRSTPSPGPPARESSSTLEKQVAANTHGAGGNAAGSKSLALAPTGEGSQRPGPAPPAGV